MNDKIRCEIVPWGRMLRMVREVTLRVHAAAARLLEDHGIRVLEDMPALMKP